MFRNNRSIKGNCKKDETFAAYNFGFFFNLTMHMVINPGDAYVH